MNESFLKNLKSATKGSSVVREPQRRSTTRRVRSSRKPEDARTIRLQLLEVDGVMAWEETTLALPDLGQFRSRGTGGAPPANAIAELEFERLPPSQITSFLADRDQTLTPHRGLRRYNHETGKLQATGSVGGASALVLVHGTFSNGENILENIRTTDEGKEFLKQAVKKYNKNVFTFDHPTLSVGPLFNALDLARQFETTNTKVDMICHSRGGLVGRWWVEAIDARGAHCNKAILVGSPLAGTGLAAPPNIRSTINLLTKFGDVLETAAGLGSVAVPVLAVVECLLRVVTSITSLAAKTPIVDAVLAMVPGLFAMSRVGNNPELLRLLEAGDANQNRYYAVKSNFEPTDPGWKFWRYFRKDQLADLAGDVIFDGDNDLVVDTPSMSSLGNRLRIPAGRTLDYGTSPAVHHLNYFHQPETIDFLSRSLL